MSQNQFFKVPLNHREFREFLKDLEIEYGDVVFNTEVRWHGRGAMLKEDTPLKPKYNCSGI